MSVYTLDNLFAFADAAPLSVEEEVALIASAQAGDADAYTRLLHAYGPTLRSHAAKAAKFTDTDDARSSALLAFAEVLASHDVEYGYENGRLASRLTPHLLNVLDTTKGEALSAFAVPSRTMKRYFGLMKAADGDVVAARALAPSSMMTVETFDSVHSAVMADSLEGLTTPDGDGPSRDFVASPVYTVSPVVDVEDAILVDVAFRAVDDEEERVCRLAYGFTEYDPQPDAEVAHRMGLTRPTVQRRRTSALGKMRKALGVTPA